MPQYLHGHTRVDVEGGQQRTAGLARAVHGDLRDLCPGDAPVEAAVEVARLDGCAIARGEDQAGVDPGSVCVVAVGVLVLLAELKRGDAQVRQREWRLG